MDIDAATIAVGTTPRGEGEGEEGVVASPGGQSRVCADFGHHCVRLCCRHQQSSMSAIVVAVD